MFPLSNWTELDGWQYIKAERIELPSIDYAHQRRVFRRDGLLMAVVMEAQVRYRTVGDLTCTTAVCFARPCVVYASFPGSSFCCNTRTIGR